MDSWLLEGLHAIERFFLHPALYICFLSSLFVGLWRVRQERKDFSFKIYNSFYEFRTSFFIGILTGIILSILLVGAGIVIPKASIVIIALWTILFAITMQYRYLSPAYSVGIAIFLFLFPNLQTEIGSYFMDIKGAYPPGLALLLALLLLAEGYMIGRSSSLSTPRLLKGKRGLSIGMHISKRLWIVPILILVPGDGLKELFSWWPIISVDSHTFSLFLVPFGIGFSKKIKGSLPRKEIAFTGRRVMALGTLVLALAIASLWLPGVAIAAAGVAILGRIAITIREELEDQKQSPYFSVRNNGLMILDIIPNSAGIEMGLKAGEVITKVNGAVPHTLQDFYKALQYNTAGAFCKMEVVDTNGQPRLVQHAMFEGDHHELGILFVLRDTGWDTKAI